MPLRRFELPADIVVAQPILDAPGHPRRAEMIAKVRALLDGPPEVAAEAAAVLSVLPDGGVTYERAEELAEVAGLWWLAAVAVVRQVSTGVLPEATLLEDLARIDRYEQRAGGNLGAVVRYSRDFKRGAVYQALGDHRRAHTAFDAAHAVAIGMGRQVWLDQLLRRRADSYVRSGELAKAFEILDEARTRATDPCVRANAVIDTAWVEIQAQRLSGVVREGVPSLTSDLDAVIALLEGRGCGVSELAVRNLAHARLHRAALAARTGPPRLAEALLAEVRPVLSPHDPEVLETMAELSARHGDATQALEHYEALYEHAGGQLEYRSRALAGRARALVQLGHRAEAIGNLQQARELYFDQGLVVPFHLGRSDYFALARVATYELSQLLVEEGRPREALDAIRDLRVQHLNGILDQDSRGARPQPAVTRELEAVRQARAVLDDIGPEWGIPRSRRRVIGRQRDQARQDLQRHTDEAMRLLGRTVGRVRSRPEPGEVLLSWMGGGTDEWLAVAERDGVARASQGAPGEPLEKVLEPLADLVEGASLVSLVPYERAQVRNPLFVSVAGMPLLDHAPARIRLDVTAPSRWSPSPARVLLVTDPTEDLRAAREEGRSLADLFESHGWQVTVLEGAQATHGAVRAAVGEADLLIYAGHGVLDPELGASLELHQGKLAVADILALPKVPRAVVLNGCGTGGTSGSGVVDVAQSFLARGSQLVVGTSGVVADPAAAIFSKTLAQRLLAGHGMTELDGELAFRAAVGELRGAGKSDWRRFLLATQ